MKISITTIPHSEQRYPTVGDWLVSEQGDWEIRVSAMSDWRYEFLVALHEMVEMAWCTHVGVKEKDVTKFDEAFEEWRETKIKMLGDQYEKISEVIAMEPGDQKAAPYYLGHQIAGVCERIAAGILGVDWYNYNNEVIAL